MTMHFETVRGTGESGVRYSLQIPFLDQPCDAFDAFTRDYASAFARVGGGLSSVVATASGEVLFDRVASVRWEITAFRDGRAAQYAVRSQVWDLTHGVLLSLRDLRLQKTEKSLRFWLKNEGKRGIGWYLQDGQIVLYRCNPNGVDPSKLRRSEYHLVLQQTAIDLEASALLSEMAQASASAPRRETAEAST